MLFRSNTPKEKRKKMGAKGRKHVNTNYGFDSFNKKWIEVLDETIENCGSWETRKNHERWSLQEVK